MKNAADFWNVIGLYNEQSWIVQIVLIALLVAAVVISYRTKYRSAIKIALAVSSVYIGVHFFMVVDRTITAWALGAPLYIAVGILFGYEAVKNAADAPARPALPAVSALVLALAYPLASLIIGHRWPQIVLYVLPCPLFSISIILYSLYPKKNIVIFILMILWAFTGLPKAFIFNVYEDFILFAAGVYGCFIVAGEIKARLVQRRGTGTVKDVR